MKSRKLLKASYGRAMLLKWSAIKEAWPHWITLAGDTKLGGYKEMPEIAPGSRSDASIDASPSHSLSS